MLTRALRLCQITSPLTATPCLRSEWRWSKWHVALLRDNGRCPNPSLRRRAGPARTAGPVGKLPGVNGLLLEPLLARCAIARRARTSERAPSERSEWIASGVRRWRLATKRECITFFFQFFLK